MVHAYYEAALLQRQLEFAIGADTFFESVRGTKGLHHEIHTKVDLIRSNDDGVFLSLR